MKIDSPLGIAPDPVPNCQLLCTIRVQTPQHPNPQTQTPNTKPHTPNTKHQTVHLCHICLLLIVKSPLAMPKPHLQQRFVVLCVGLGFGVRGLGFGED